MGYWIYMQAFLDLALLAALGALLAERRRRLPVAAWQREVGALVETLSELVVEVDRVTRRGAPGPGASPALDESALAEAVFAGDAAGDAGGGLDADPDAVAAPAFLPADPESDLGADAPAPRPGSLLDDVLAFARAGLKPEDIARRVGRPVGEVTLMLGLSRAHAVPAGR
jgi:hypothetical protein